MSRQATRQQARHATTPSPFKHSTVSLYSNGGTSTPNTKTGLVTNRTPQVRGRVSGAKVSHQVTRQQARNVTTGSKLVPSPVKTYKNKHSTVTLYSNGGTSTQNTKTGLVTNRTPQARSQGGRAAVYRIINEKNQAYIGSTDRGLFSGGQDIVDGPRVREHKAERGSAVTREDSRHHVDVVNIHATKYQARQDETQFYHATKETHGESTRGAGNTTRRSYSTSI